MLDPWVRDPWIRDAPLPRRPLVVLAAVMAGGCVMGTMSPVPAWGWWCGGIVALGGWLILAAHGPDAAAVACGWATVALTAACWSAGRIDLFTADDVAWRLDEQPRPCILRGVVVEPARVLRGSDSTGPAASACTVAVSAVRGPSGWERASGRARVVVAAAEPVAVPDGQVEVLGRASRPGPSRNPGGFDAASAARSTRCLSVVRTTAWGIRAVGPPRWSAVRWAAGLRGWGQRTLATHVGAARAPLAASLLIGGRSGLDATTAHHFLVTGTVHILSISGLHVGLLAAGLIRLLRLVALPRWTVFCVVVGCTGVYMLVAGGDVPVVRATLVVWCGAIAAAASRRGAVANALAVAAIVILAHDPAAVRDPGAQLSFLSTMVLVLASRAVLPDRSRVDPIERLIDRSRSSWERWLRTAARWLVAAAAVNVAVWTATAPLVAREFHLVSPVGLLLNLVVAPLVSAAMAAGAACLACAPWSVPLADGCGVVCAAALVALEATIAMGAETPGGHVWVAGPPAWWVVGWYVVIGGTLLAVRTERLRRAGTWGAVALGWCVIGGLGALAARPSSDAALRITLAAVGHGCGIVARSPGGGVLVYDAGRLGAADGAGRTLASVLWDAGCRGIDVVVLSHADADHVNGLPVIMDRFTIGMIVVSPAFVVADGHVPRRVLAEARRRGIPIRVMAGGATFAIDRFCRVRILHPAPAWPPYGRDNEESLVVAVESAGRRVLLTGDLEAAALRAFVAGGPQSCDVLVAPHHGARTSLPPGIARATSPAYVLVSGAAGEGWAAVRSAYEAVTARGAVLATGADGALRVTLSAAAVTAERYAGGRWRPVRPRPPGPDA